jgi:hypothetical protein
MRRVFAVLLAGTAFAAGCGAEQAAPERRGDAHPLNR